MDPYANYFCQKFYFYIKSADKFKFLKQVNKFLTQKDKKQSYINSKQ